MTEKTADEQEIFDCAQCGVPILTFWAPNGGGLLRGEYTLFGDLVFHPKCLDKHLEAIPPMSKDVEEAYDRFFGL